MVAQQPAHGPSAGRSGCRGRESQVGSEQAAALGVPVEEHGRERRDRRGQAEHGARQRPALVDRHEHGHQAVGDEDDAVDHAEDADAELGGLGDVLQEHAETAAAPR